MTRRSRWLRVTRRLIAHRAGRPQTRRVSWLRVGVAGCLIGAFTLGCRPSSSAPPALRMWTDDLALLVSTDPVPPPARQDIMFKVVVRDKASGQAIEGGEGRVFATNSDGINTWDALTAGPQAGTYYAKLNFITAGDWALGMQFRRDSTRPIERLDWRQEVHGAAGEAPIR
jgi:hypothetical protein